jgi:hypothetical protein
MNDPEKDGMVCDLCRQEICDVSRMDADAFGNARDMASEEIFIMVRCRYCCVTTVVMEGGEA